MLKRDEIADPKSCLNRAADDEIVFVLRAKDLEAPDTIRDWVRRRVKNGHNRYGDDKVMDALCSADAMEQWQIKKGLLTP